MRYTELGDPDCAIAQALAVVGDPWTLLLIRDVAGGTHQFDALRDGLGISRKVLTERLKTLVADGVLEKRLYSPHPPRYEYHLTPAGRGLLPVLVALQDWGARHVLGDGALSATSPADSAETRRVHALVGRTLPPLELAGPGGVPADPVSADHTWTVLYCFPGAYAPGGHDYPPGWDRIPGTLGCTLESCTYRDRMAEFARRDARVHGVSTQRPDQLAAFAEHERIAFPLLSDADLQLAAALRLPTFRAAGVDRLKRLTLVLDASRTVRGVLYPLDDPAGSVDDALALVDSRTGA
ncbi:winged helix-turn-helix transcriptional regulator [Streptomyces sp. NRRL S-340]|uniref:winged helix-turn-helix transcriptional regulator n=1 Tax=Streptomyces sp. NRRL S-340 TaxID=1463901 RepID=UPI00055B0FFD|nr:winged helix-turn-helix transcriptional regulator [Streptomyces sp. NRRL S-340]